LRSEFGDDVLHRVGVIERGPDGMVRLKPELVNPAGALIALRREAGELPFALITPRGCLPARSNPMGPITAALEDATTVERARHFGILFATPRVREVALLRAIGFPATLILGITKADLGALKALDKRFAKADQPHLGPEGTEPADSATAETPASAPAPPTAPASCPEGVAVRLGLLGWSPLRVSPKPWPTVAPAVALLAEARRHLRLGFAEVGVWCLDDPTFKALRFRVRYRSAADVYNLLWEFSIGLDSVEAFSRPPGGGTGAPDGPVPGLAEAQAALSGALAAERAAVGPPDTRRAARRRAVRDYDKAVRNDLTNPLEAAALADSDPVARNEGVMLANICLDVHAIAPHLHDLITACFESGGSAEQRNDANMMLNGYLTLLARATSLVRDYDSRRTG
jgi:hypothetical protein